MYDKFTKPYKQSSGESSLSLKYKIRRLSMEKKVKVGALCGIMITTIFYVLYSLHFHWNESTSGPFSLGVGAEILGENSCPITKPVKTDQGLTYRIGIITDLDEKSKHPNKPFTWFSYMKRGKLVRHSGDSGAVSVVWDNDDIEYTSSLAQGGRGMELSELICFDGKILSVDDRTGVVYQIMDRHVIPWVVMADGAGTETKGFKGEWATVKDGELYVGGLGKEWTSNTGEILSFNPQYVKIISPSGAVIHVSWVNHYRKLLETAGISPPGYLIHEAAVWSGVNRKWFFLPRRASKLKYNEKTDERCGTNMLLSCREDFSQCDRTLVGPLNFTHGFSSLKFIPGTNEQHIVALKTEEVDGKISSYVMAFDLNGKILMKEQKIPGSFKFEGIEFL